MFLKLVLDQDVGAMMNLDWDGTAMRFTEMEERFGKESATVILKALEKFEGIASESVVKLSPEERLDNVYERIAEDMMYQTRH